MEKPGRSGLRIIFFLRFPVSPFSRFPSPLKVSLLALFIVALAQGWH